MLPRVSQASLDVRPIDWSGLPKRFLNLGELEVLIALVASVTPRTVVEFGVNVGRTAKAILGNVPGIERYVGVDVPPGYVPSLTVQRNEIPQVAGQLVRDDPRFNLIVRPRGTLDLRYVDLPDCDVVFIDGDHGREAVRHDSVLAAEIVRPGGIVIWHDYNDLGKVAVRDVLDEFHLADPEIKHVDGTWLAFRRWPRAAGGEVGARCTTTTSC